MAKRIKSWNIRHQIDGKTFIIAESSGRIKTILGYPTREISLATRQVGQRFAMKI
ncbi:MAG: hypothetical protein ONB45_17215 [candidate division KSB1 bacterium]|nr:hypothetical protein [candidate division KSB1 bacterium]